MSQSNIAMDVEMCSTSNAKYISCLKIHTKRMSEIMKYIGWNDPYTFPYVFTKQLE